MNVHDVMSMLVLDLFFIFISRSYASLPVLFDDATLFYHSYHYDFPPNATNDSTIFLTDAFNNTFSFHSPDTLTINGDIHLHWHNDDDWMEIQHPQNAIAHSSRRRRLFWKRRWKYSCNWFERTFMGCRTWYEHPAAMPPNGGYAAPYWRRNKIVAGRYVAWYPGYRNKNGFNYHRASAYCEQNFGGLATIHSKKENRLVFSLCRDMLAPYKKRTRSRKVCSVFRGCRYIKYYPPLSWAHEKAMWKGRTCWIGLQRGDTSKKKHKPFSLWDDRTRVQFKNWSPEEPNYLKKRHCRMVGENERQCRTTRKYDQKCSEILAYRPKGHRAKSNNNALQRRRRTRGGAVAAEASGKAIHLQCEPGSTIDVVYATYGASCGANKNNALRALKNKCDHRDDCRYYISKRRLGDPAKECPKNYIYGFKCIRELETSQSGKFNYNEIEGVGGNLVEQKWDNTYCHRKRVPICQKPRGEIYDDQYIAVRASRTYQQAAQWCQTWYGTTLATIDSEKDNLKASAACRAMHVSGTRHCWIGLQRPYQRWDDGTDISKFESWAPGEPNNYGGKENCAELYSKNEKWNDLGCGAKRFFLCNSRTEIQRMKYKEREEMIAKRLQRFSARWKAFRRMQYRRHVRNEYFKKLREKMKRRKAMQRQLQQRRRDAVRQKVFKQRFGGFMRVHGGFFGGARQMDKFAGTAAQKRWKRQSIRAATNRLSHLLQQPAGPVPMRFLNLQNYKQRIMALETNGNTFKGVTDGMYARRAITRMNNQNMPDPVMGGLGYVPPMMKQTNYHGLVYPPPPPKVQFLGTVVTEKTKSDGKTSQTESSDNAFPLPPKIKLVDPGRRRLVNEVNGPNAFPGFIGSRGGWISPKRQMAYYMGTGAHQRWKQRQRLKRASRQLSNVLRHPYGYGALPMRNLNLQSYRQKISALETHGRTFQNAIRELQARRAMMRWHYRNMPDPVVGGLGYVPPMVKQTKYHGLIFPPPPPKVQFVSTKHRKSDGRKYPTPPRIQLVDTERRRLLSSDRGYIESVQRIVDGIHDDNDHDAVMTKSERRRVDRHLRLEENAKTYGVGDYPMDYPVDSLIDSPLESVYVDIQEDDDQIPFEELDLFTKCTLFDSNGQVLELCIGINGMDITQFIRKQMKDDVHSITTYNESMFLMNHTDDEYVNYMEYEQMKYTLFENGTLPIELGGNGIIHGYHLRERVFVYDSDSNHQRQCWDSIYELRLCLEYINDGDRDDMLMEVMAPSVEGRVQMIESCLFSVDLQWDEVNLIQNRESTETIRKCMHAFEAKVCLERTTPDEALGLSCDVYKATVFLHSADLSQISFV